MNNVMTGHVSSILRAFFYKNFKCGQRYCKTLWTKPSASLELSHNKKKEQTKKKKTQQQKTSKWINIASVKFSGMYK